MRNSPQRTKTTMVLTGIASLVIGFFLFSNPTGVALFATSLFGGVLAIAGVMTLIGYARARDQASQADLLIGLIELVFGAILWTWPAMFVSWLVVLIGVFILFTGIGDLVEARAIAALGAPTTAATLMAALTIVFGFVVMGAPFAFVGVMFAIAGCGLVFNGVTEIVAAFKK